MVNVNRFDRLKNVISIWLYCLTINFSLCGVTQKRTDVVPLKMSYLVVQSGSRATSIMSTVKSSIKTELSLDINIQHFKFTKAAQANIINSLHALFYHVNILKLNAQQSCHSLIILNIELMRCIYYMKCVTAWVPMTLTQVHTLGRY